MLVAEDISKSLGSIATSQKVIMASIIISSAVFAILLIAFAIYIKFFVDRVSGQLLDDDQEKLLKTIKKADKKNKKGQNLSSFELNYEIGKSMFENKSIDARITVYNSTNDEKEKIDLPCCKELETRLNSLAEAKYAKRLPTLNPVILAGTHGLGKSHVAQFFAQSTKGEKRFVIKVDAEKMVEYFYGDFSKGLLKLKEYVNKLASHYKDSTFVLLIDEFDGYILKNQSRLYKKDIGDCLETNFKNSQNIQVIFAMNNSCVMKAKYWDNSKTSEELMDKDTDLQKAAEFLLDSDRSSSRYSSLFEDEKSKKSDEIKGNKALLLREGQLSKLMSLCTKYDFKPLTKDQACEWVNKLDSQDTNVFIGIFSRNFTEDKDNMQFLKNNFEKIREKVIESISNDKRNRDYNIRDINDFFSTALNSVLSEETPSHELENSFSQNQRDDGGTRKV